MRKTISPSRLRTVTLPCLKMMKKILTVFLLLCLLLLVSCGGDRKKEEQSATEASKESIPKATSATEQVTQAPTSTKEPGQGFAGEEDIFG